MNQFHYFKKTWNLLKSDHFVFHKVLTSKIKCLPHVFPYARNYRCPGMQCSDTHGYAQRLKGLEVPNVWNQNSMCLVPQNGPQTHALGLDLVHWWPPQGPSKFSTVSLNASNMCCRFPKGRSDLFQGSCVRTDYKERGMELNSAWY